MARPKVGLFVTCLVDLLRPNIGFAALKLLDSAGCETDVPRAQTCCGQPAYNSGDRETAAAVARQVIETFERFDYVVAPSGSCAGMLRVHFPALLAGDPDWAKRAKEFASRCHELVSFLVNVRGMTAVAARCESSACYHDSCSSLREMRVRDEPRKLLASVEGLRLNEISDGEACCGFGGAFCVKYPDISARIGSDKLDNVARTGTDLVLAADLGCLVHLAGLAERQNRRLRFRHVAEVLVEDTETPPMGGSP